MFAAMEQLIYLDYALFEWIHHGLQHPWLDTIMPLWREKTTWIPMYLLGAVLLVSRYRLKGFFFLLALGATVGTADFTSSEIIKKRKKGEIWPFPASGLDGVPVKCQNIASMFCR